tara:strand:- start:1103 stop:1915 length:813 start_codon:yes stop_codon:yes gene_type:complete
VWEKLMTKINIKTSISFTIVLFLSCSVFAERLVTDDESHINDPRIQHLSYLFPPTGELIPYALFVPSTYNEVDEAPLIISLHGLGRSYDWLMGYHGFLDEAEANGYIVVTPLGYIRRGWYGSRPTEDPIDAKYSEQDVMEVIDLIINEYAIDSNRIYLWGHSMGGAGTYHIAAKNPEMFAALGVAAPAPLQDLDIDKTLNRIKHIPTFVLQGDEDGLVTLTRRWVSKMQDIGMQHVYAEIPGGDHSLVISQNSEHMGKFIDFFNIVRKNY